jgi:hypothetical protein
MKFFSKLFKSRRKRKNKKKMKFFLENIAYSRIFNEHIKIISETTHRDMKNRIAELEDKLNENKLYENSSNGSDSVTLSLPIDEVELSED